MRGRSHFTDGEIEAWGGEFAQPRLGGRIGTKIYWPLGHPSEVFSPPPPCSSSPTPTPNSLKEPPLSHCRPEKSSPPPPPATEELRCHSAWGQMEQGSAMGELHEAIQGRWQVQS